MRALAAVHASVCGKRKCPRCHSATKRTHWFCDGRQSPLHCFGGRGRRVRIIMAGGAESNFFGSRFLRSGAGVTPLNDHSAPSDGVKVGGRP
jgi:hypothetical protein